MKVAIKQQRIKILVDAEEGGIYENPQHSPHIPVLSSIRLHITTQHAGTLRSAVSLMTTLCAMHT